MDSYNMDNEYDVLIQIFRFIRDYSTSTYTLPQVCNALVLYLQDYGYDVEITDSKHRDFRNLRVNSFNYRIIRNTGWSAYDVVMISQQEGASA